jgi:two-component system, NtrC family, nitrogen regulation response regulator GlnG
MHKILIVDDEKSVRYSFSKILNTGKFELYEAENFDTAMAMFQSVRPDLAIVDIEMPGKTGLDLLKAIKEHSPRTPVIIVTAFGSGDRVIRAMKFGAYEYIEKPFDIPNLINLIDEALRSVELKTDCKASQTKKIKIIPKKPIPNEEEIIGESPAIKDVYKLIGRVAASDASILVTGESGTGKELVARAIHHYSDRVAKPFIAINCAAIPETLLESELFGYEKGAFTGANKDKPGKFEEANEGTLFLDEIGDMGLLLQSKLLRVLQEGKVDRLGSSKTIRVNVRIIAATNKSLENLIAKKSFREDLYYRIRVISIALPPLRMRKNDIPLLVNHFLAKHAHEVRNENISLHPDTMERLLKHSWPGNIRELENTIKRALVLSKGNVIMPQQIIEDNVNPAAVEHHVSDRLANYLSDDMVGKEGEIFDLVSKALEKDLIKWALARTGNNQVKAAKLLGISRVMLHERMERFGLEGR